jgi:hypothetical protein
MDGSFQIVALPYEPFAPLFAMDDAGLHACGARRMVVHETPGTPCRVSLEDAAIGEELLLLPYLHQPAESPYRTSGPVFVRRGARQARLPAGVVPSYVTSRLMSVRAYDASHMIVAASVCDGVNAGDEISAHFRRPEVAYIHLHNAARGCFSCQVVRA